ncbi:hypothetical protein [Paenibacillus paeoniae]|uniref:Uncharacterized protein n=1 Tax=Paenibacillus paeoniae TaxID=2292705 RepID=A0A371PMK7_9BACL|nr:hypothetical protein [Paenibacillus paeoniae]REK77408.1 hypothetical protein DX130_10535 [Paenibacillus paeoniae]
MDIIEFLTKYFYFILIALFFVARMFSNSGNKRKPPQTMPTFGGDPSQDGNQEGQPDFQQAQPAVVQTRPESVYRTRMNAQDGQSDDSFPGSYPLVGIDDRSRSADYGSSGGRRGRASAQRSTDNRSESETIANPGAGLTKSDLRKAFIWSEVLGAPKARRPYRRP